MGDESTLYCFNATERNDCSFVIGPMSQLCDCLAEIPQAATAVCEKHISVSNSRSEPPVPGICALLW